MRLMIIRHGDPDYSIDSLTEKGWKEAALLAERMEKIGVTDFYVSPLGRAKDTASLTLKKMNREAVVCDWLREFHAPIVDIRTAQRRIPWDWLPEDWTSTEEYYGKDTWHRTDVMEDGKVYEEYKRVAKGIDGILEQHGYVREGNLYRVEKANKDTIVLFCHFGVECVLLSYLTGVSPMIYWHHFCAAPSSVTTIWTEERREKKAIFRISAFGDISHLYAGGEEPAFAARFCEVYDEEGVRKD